jgi:RNA polymerase sigma-70 factor, ECF subfamily
VDRLAHYPFWPREIVDARPDSTAGLNQSSDLELVAEINGGNEAAFAVLYHRHRDWVVNLAWRWTGNRDTALDVLQETFFYLSRKFPGFTLTAKLQTFFYPVVRNLSIAARRKLERFDSRASAEVLAERIESPEPPANSRDQLQAVLATLTEEHREVLLLRFVDGLSLSEISAAMDIPLGTVKSRLHNGLDTLRKDPRTTKLFEE